MRMAQALTTKRVSSAVDIAGSSKVGGRAGREVPGSTGAGGLERRLLGAARGRPLHPRTPPRCVCWAQDLDLEMDLPVPADNPDSPPERTWKLVPTSKLNIVSERRRQQRCAALLAALRSALGAAPAAAACQARQGGCFSDRLAPPALRPRAPPSRSSASSAWARAPPPSSATRRQVGAGWVAGGGGAPPRAHVVACAPAARSPQHAVCPLCRSDAQEAEHVPHRAHVPTILEAQGRRVPPAAVAGHCPGRQARARARARQAQGGCAGRGGPAPCLPARGACRLPAPCRRAPRRVWPKEDERDVQLFITLVYHVTGACG